MDFEQISAKWMRRLIHFWPPLWFTGIHFDFIADNFRQVDVSMPLRSYNKNIIGIQYGGNLFSMTDPCYMLMLMRNMGSGYHVIDQSVTIQFIKPGRSKVYASCRLTDDDVDDIMNHTASGETYFKTFLIDVLDSDNEQVASIERVVYIRKKQ